MARTLKVVRLVAKHAIRIAIGLIFLYPLLWILGSSFKENSEILNSISLFPSNPTFQGYLNGWEGSGQYPFGVFLWNTLVMVIPMVVFTVVSSIVVGYGFARFQFKGRKFFFAAMIATLMLPGTVTLIPQYIMFSQIGWVDSYLPFWVPNLFGTGAFFVFLMHQFLRGIPRELDESAYIDGCGSFQILTSILVPLSSAAIFSVIIFQFVWSWNSFLNVLVYVNSVANYPVALGLRMTLDFMEETKWNEIMAMSVVTIIPPVLIYFFAQKYFVEGIASTGLKG